MAQFFAIAITLILIYRQVRLQRQANMLQTLASLDNRWNSQDMLSSRKKACENYLTDELRINREQGDVLAFFEDIGVYLLRGASILSQFGTNIVIISNTIGRCINRT